LAELRDLLYLEPSEKGWEKTISILDSINNPKIAIDYAEHHLENWPDQLRIAKDYNIAFKWWKKISEKNLFQKT